MFLLTLNHEPLLRPTASPSRPMTWEWAPSYLHCLDLREVPCRNLVFSLQLKVDFREPVDKFSLLVFLSKHIWHLLLQVADDVGMYLKGDAR